jgi:hypothetical protein
MASANDMFADQASAVGANAHLRREVVERMLETVSAVGLNRAVFIHAVYLLDALAARRPLSILQLRHIGVAILWISMKFHCSYSPSVEELANKFGCTASLSRLTSLEASILRVLEYKLMLHMPVARMEELLIAEHCDLQENAAAWFVLEASLYFLAMATMPPDALAQAAVSFVCCIFRGGPSSSYSGKLPVLRHLLGIVEQVWGTSSCPAYRRYAASPHFQDLLKILDVR